MTMQSQDPATIFSADSINTTNTRHSKVYPLPPEVG